MFGDFRGPAFVGFMLAAFVLCGYAVLGTLSLDTRFNGLLESESIERVISRQREEIDELNAAWVNAASKREAIVHSENMGSKRERLNFENLKLQVMLDEKAKTLSSVNESLAEVAADFHRYVKTYRSGAKGENLGTLRTDDGKIYEDARVLEVNDGWMHIRHGHGTVRIPSESLPLAFRERFHFDRKKATSFRKDYETQIRGEESDLAREILEVKALQRKERLAFLLMRIPELEKSIKSRSRIVNDYDKKPQYSFPLAETIEDHRMRLGLEWAELEKARIEAAGLRDP